MQHPELILRFGIALLIGVLIGLERECAAQRGRQGVRSRAVVLAVIANTVVKGGIALTTGSGTLRRALLPRLLLMLIVSAVTGFLLV